MFQRSEKPGRHRGRLAIALAAAFAVAVITPAVAQANLTGSTFEGNDGNMVVDTSGHHDWANVSPNTGTDIASGKTDNSFGQGTKEDSATPTVVTGSIPPNKNDLTRFYESSEQVASGDIYLYLAWERLVNIGNANLDFEINQMTSPGFTGAPGASTITRTAGDLLINYDFGGSGTPTLGYSKWLTAAAGNTASQCNASSTLPCWGLHTTFNSTVAEGAVNTGSIAESIAGGTLGTGLFGEAAINLTAAGVFQQGVCEAFGSAFIKSRSSSSFTAELKDFIAPIPVSISNCGTITVKKVVTNAPAGDSTSFGYTTTGTGLSNFSLTGGGKKVFTPLGQGAYSVSENTVTATGWSFVSVSCKDDTTSSSVGTVTGQKVDITLSPGQDVTCTYTNHYTNSPTIATTLSDTSITVGGSVHDSSALTGASAGATGTVTYTVYTDDKCTVKATPSDGGTKTLNADGTVPDSDALTFNTPGDYYWQAVYTSGDGNNNNATSTCTDEHLVVNKAQPTVATAQNLIPNDTMTVSGGFGTPGGTVDFMLFSPSDPTCSGTPAYKELGVAVSGGSASTTNTGAGAFIASDAGTWNWKSVYSGDSNNKGATSACGVEHFTIVNK
ncbi:hypothetical protein LK09_16450 [Microbacterium mangrovi]|uniref:Ig-like domain-containing protein n=1 Tax=Microbacterium mangrovi TaxID=1348253 RepID=A0A0B2A377_9MICO|nr:hypothetical protein [Microbacterium mangrovi]KHK96219.1 hypothetical protein LK09_16450 [Microbacterium mangrovi]